MASSPTNSHPSLQELICQQVFALSSNCPRAKVHTVLDPLLEVDFSDTEDDIQRMGDDKIGSIDRSFSVANDDARTINDIHSNTIDVTPLMVACDRGNKACLDYILEKLQSVEKSKEPLRFRRAKTRKLRSLLGNPLMDLSVRHHNTAMHYAATAGCSAAISILQRIQSLLLIHEEYQTSPKREYQENNQVIEKSKCVSVPIVLRLGSARNAHNDTPLMMATQSSHAYEFVTAWFDLAWKEQQSLNHGNEPASKTALQEILEARNDSNDTCLSLACSHGYVDLVQFLIGNDSAKENNSTTCWNAKVNVSADELSRCQSSFERMEQALKCSPKLNKEYKSKCDNVKVCLQRLESHLSCISELATQELLNEEELVSKEGSSTSAIARTKHKKKKKNVNKRIPITSTASSILGDFEHSESNGVVDDDKDIAIVSTLPNGKIAVRVKGREESLESGEGMVEIMQKYESPDAMDMLRERCKGVSSEVDSFMSALCLDVKCLLYSEHGMALNLSPAQLDAVQQILERQLESVQKAREIQQRKHQTQKRQTW